MAITTGGGINFDQAQQSRDNRARNLQMMTQAAQFAVGAEQKNKEQALQTGAQKFAQLMALAGPDPVDAQNYLATEAGSALLADIQKDMSRASGKNLSPEEAMQGAYVAASKYYANNPSLESQLRETWKHVLPQRGNAPAGAVTPETARTVNKPGVSPQNPQSGITKAQRSTQQLEPVPADFQEKEVGSWMNEVAMMKAEFGPNPTPEQQGLLDQYLSMGQAMGLDPEELANPSIAEIARNSPSLNMTDVRKVAIKNYPELYTADGKYRTKAMRESELDSDTYNRMDAQGRAFRAKAEAEARGTLAAPSVGPRTQQTGGGQPTQLAPGAQPMADRRGPADMGQGLAGIPGGNPFMPGMPNLAADLNQESLPMSRGVPLNPAQVAGARTLAMVPQPQPVPAEQPGTPLPTPGARPVAEAYPDPSSPDAMAQAANQQTAALKEVVANMDPAKAARGEIPATPEQQKLGRSIVQLTQAVEKKYAKLKDNPVRGAMDIRLGGLYDGLKEFAVTAIDKVKNGLPMSMEERQKLAIANRGFESFSEKLDKMPMAEVRALQKEYLAWAETATYTELGAAGLDKMADREIQAYVVNAQANAAMARTLASAGSEEAKALVEMQKVAMDGWSKAEENIAKVMVAEKKTRAQVIQAYPEMFEPVKAFAPMAVMKPIEMGILKTRNLFELFTKQKGQGSGAAYGTYVTDKSQAAKPLTDAEKAAALNKYNKGKS